MRKRVNLPRDVVQLLNDFQEKAIRYGRAYTDVMGNSVEDEARAEMLKARYRLEKKLLDQGQLARKYMKLRGQ